MFRPVSTSHRRSLHGDFFGIKKEGRDAAAAAAVDNQIKKHVSGILAYTQTDGIRWRSV